MSIAVYFFAASDSLVAAAASCCLGGEQIGISFDFVYRESSFRAVGSSGFSDDLVLRLFFCGISVPTLVHMVLPGLLLLVSTFCYYSDGLVVSMAVSLLRRVFFDYFLLMLLEDIRGYEPFRRL